MTGSGPAGGDGPRGDDPRGDSQRGDGRRGDAFRGPAGVQRGSGNLQINFHEHRAGIISACAVALVCVATVIAVRVGSSPGTGAAGPTTGNPTAGSPATGPASAPGAALPGTAGADPSVLTGRLVNDGSGLCLRAPGTDDGLVPVQDACTGDTDRTWTLAPQNATARTARTVRNASSGRCVTATGPDNFAPTRQLACTANSDGQHWELLWGTGDRAGHFMLRGTGSSPGGTKCLVVQGGTPARPAVQAPCGEEYDDQWWHLTT
ncbi:RICIN domain-containing protein [Kitasatospora sp. NPDC059577]|uniref:RICIN domain-containing protein n=1 Tax=Kitasatospora sp. NPDC059577 TaxID=3346873 RepID=UPI0036755377